MSGRTNVGGIQRYLGDFDEPSDEELGHYREDEPWLYRPGPRYQREKQTNQQGRK